MLDQALFYMKTTELLYCFHTFYCIIHTDEYILAVMHIALMITQNYYLLIVIFVYSDQTATFTTHPVGGNSFY